MWLRLNGIAIFFHLIEQVAKPTIEFFKKINIIMAVKKASEELLAAPLPEMIKDLGLAVAAANKALTEDGSDIRYTIPEADVELKVAISIDSTKEVTAGIEVGLSAVSVNASYSSTFGFKEEASSKITLKIRAAANGPEQAGAQPAGNG